MVKSGSLSAIPQFLVNVLYTIMSVTKKFFIRCIITVYIQTRHAMTANASAIMYSTAKLLVSSSVTVRIRAELGMLQQRPIP